MRKRIWRLVTLVSGLTLASIIACGGTSQSLKNSAPKSMTASASGSSSSLSNQRCDTKRPNVEVSYRDISGSGKADLLEVVLFERTAGGKTEGKVVCVELDTNHDGTLDLIRIFNDRGDIEKEEVDRNFDGKVDLWIEYGKNGLIEKMSYDKEFRGKPNEFHHYRGGKLKFITRDRNYDDKIDVWEYFNSTGHIERIGLASDGGENPSVWFRDEMARAEAKKASDATAASASASATPSSSGPVRAVNRKAPPR